MFDVLGMGVGFIFVLFCLGVVWEVLGNGSVFGFGFFLDFFQEWIVMILLVGGFFILVIWLLFFNILK